MKLPTLVIAMLFCVPGIAAAEVQISTPDAPQCRFAEDEIRAALTKASAPGDWIVTFKVVNPKAAPDLQPEGYEIERSTRAAKQLITISAIDTGGLLYGGLEVAEIIRTAGIAEVQDDTQNPYMAMRGTKFNIPLDAGRLVTPMFATPRRSTSRKCGTLISGKSTSIRWRDIDTTTSHSGTCTLFLRW